MNTYVLPTPEWWTHYMEEYNTPNRSCEDCPLRSSAGWFAEYTATHTRDDRHKIYDGVCENCQHIAHVATGEWRCTLTGVAVELEQGPCKHYEMCAVENMASWGRDRFPEIDA